MGKVLKINKSVEKGIIDLLKFLLESKKINGVLTLRKLGQNNVDYALITDVSGLDNAVPFYPLMPANAGKMLSHFTLKKPIKKPIAAVVRPCELRAFIELVKREQGSLDNFLFAVKGFDGEISEEDFESSEISSLLEKRKAEKEKLFDEIHIENLGLEGMVEVFGKCIGCHVCSRVCPICYCILCDFESATYDYTQSDYENELHKKGGLRLPPDTIFFQIGRLTHMSFSCVGCGMCTDVCPVDIPVAAIFQKTGEETRQIFDYLPGKDVEEIIPVMIFKEEEFTELGE